MKAQSIIIEKKKYRLIADDEYKQLKEDIRDLNIILKRRDEKQVEANDFFAKQTKGKK